MISNDLNIFLIFLSAMMVNNILLIRFIGSRRTMICARFDGANGNSSSMCVILRPMNFIT